MNNLVEANSWPHLSVSSGNLDPDGTIRIKLTVVNEGIGPAKLHSLVVLYDGEPTTDLWELLEECCYDNPDGFASLDDYIAFAGMAGTATPWGKVIRAGDENLIFTMELVEGSNDEAWGKLNQTRLGNLTFEACYCSVFDECWTTDLTSINKTPVASCAADPNSWRG